MPTQTAFWWTPKYLREKKMYFLLFIHTPYQEMTGRRIWAQMHQKPQTQRSFRKACDELNCSTYYLTEHESYIKQKTCLAFLTEANPNPLKNKWGNLWRWRKRSINAKKHPFREKKCLCCRVLASVCFTEHIHTHTLEASCLNSLMRIKTIWHNFLLKHRFWAARLILISSLFLTENRIKTFFIFNSLEQEMYYYYLFINKMLPTSSLICQI